MVAFDSRNNYTINPIIYAAFVQFNFTRTVSILNLAATIEDIED
jgi:hypothetical protein